MGEARRRTDGEQLAPFRLAIREEGEWIHVYFATRPDGPAELADTEPVLVATLRTTAGHMPGVQPAFLTFTQALAKAMLDTVAPGAFRGVVLEDPPADERRGEPPGVHG